MKNNNLVIGFLAHVDSGKTTLSEAVMYTAGVIRKLGRVDHKTAFLDNDSVEQERGITVFSKEARFKWAEKRFTLLDTPGHVDFGTEAERTLAVLDYGILIISGSEGVQSHTVTLWKLLESYKIPAFIFVNKMDQAGTDKTNLMSQLKSRLRTSSEQVGAAAGFAEFWEGHPVSIEEAASCDENLLEEYLEKDQLSESSIASAIAKRNLFPVCFGSALKLEGIREFLDTMEKCCVIKEYPEEFGARVYKITRDKQGVRQTHMKITGGRLQGRMLLDTGDREEKVDRIRFYSGKTFEQVPEAKVGEICAVTGLSETYAGQGLGAEKNVSVLTSYLKPSLTYRVILEDGTDPVVAFQKFKRLEEEEPSLHLSWKESSQEIHVRVMGKLELDILRHIAKERFDMDIAFGDGSIIYKETIAKPVIGIGHFEPLRHYAEVQLLMEPLERGAGLVFETGVSEDMLDRNWQRLILTHLQEREFPGVLTGSPITDMRITLIGGKGHIKHTEGGDFRQATYRAVRQGLCKAENVLLEPFYSFRAEIPAENVGRLLSDMQKLGGECSSPEMQDPSTSVITGKAPVSSINDYQQEVMAYTKGTGRFSVFPAGYGECHDSRQVVENMGYRAESDLDNPCGSVFCMGGSAVYVDWDEVDEMAHVDSGYRITEDGRVENHPLYYDAAGLPEELLLNDNGHGRGSDSRAGKNVPQKELDEIFLRTYGKSKRDEELRRRQLSGNNKKPARPKTMSGSFPKLERKPRKNVKPYYIVDGYNIIFAWTELSELAAVNIDSAREALIEVLQNYSAYKKVGMTVVFDGYKVSGNPGTKQRYGELEVVYTKEAQTADRFIEEAVYRMNGDFDVTVVTSDRPVQMAAMGDGAAGLSSRDFYGEVVNASEEIRRLLGRQRRQANRPLDGKFDG